MRKNTWIKMGVIIGFLLIFIGYNVYLKWEKANFTVDSEAFNVKENFEQVMEEEYKWTEGLQLANQFDKLQDIGITKELSNGQRQLTLHTAWDGPQGFYILYSINLQKEDQTPDDIPELNFSNITMETSDGHAVTFKTMPSDAIKAESGESGEEYEGEVLDKRLYRSLVLVMDPESVDADVLEGVEDFFEKMNTITLEEASLIKRDDKEDSFENNDANSKEPINNLTVNIDFDEDYEEHLKYTTIPLHQEITLSTGHTLEIHGLDITAYGNTMHLSIEKENQPIKGVEVAVTWEDKDTKEETSSNEILSDNNEYSTLFMPFDSIPSQLDVKMKNIIYSIDDISFEVPANMDVTDTSEKIGEVEGIPYYFEGYEEAHHRNFDEDIAEEIVGLKLSWEPNSPEMFPYQEFTLHHDLQKQLDDIDDEQGKEWWLEDATNIIYVENEKGEKPIYKNPNDHPNNPNLVNNQKTIIIYLDKSFVEKSEEILLTVDDFTYEEKLRGEEFQVDIPEEYVSGEQDR